MALRALYIVKPEKTRLATLYALLEASDEIHAEMHYGRIITIDNTQDRKMQEKLNPFHARFTAKTVCLQN